MQSTNYDFTENQVSDVKIQNLFYESNNDKSNLCFNPLDEEYKDKKVNRNT